MLSWGYSYFLSPELPIAHEPVATEPVATEPVRPIAQIQPDEYVQPELEATSGEQILSIVDSVDKIFNDQMQFCKEHGTTPHISILGIVLHHYNKIPDSDYQVRLYILSQICKYAHINLIKFRKNSNLEFAVYDKLITFIRSLDNKYVTKDIIAQIVGYKNLLFNSQYIERLAHEPVITPMSGFIGECKRLLGAIECTTTVKQKVKYTYNFFAYLYGNLDFIRSNKEFEKSCYIKLTAFSTDGCYTDLAMRYKNLMFPIDYGYCSLCYNCSCRCTSIP
jgi:hypothetical protein